MKLYKNYHKGDVSLTSQKPASVTSGLMSSLLYRIAINDIQPKKRAQEDLEEKPLTELEEKQLSVLYLQCFTDLSGRKISKLLGVDGAFIQQAEYKRHLVPEKENPPKLLKHILSDLVEQERLEFADKQAREMERIEFKAYQEWFARSAKESPYTVDQMASLIGDKRYSAHTRTLARKFDFAIFEKVSCLLKNPFVVV